MNNKYNKLVHWACNYNFLYGNNKFILWFNWYFIMRWNKDIRKTYSKVSKKYTLWGGK